MKERNFLMAGGGTGGHVIPALAVARELRTRGHHVFFVGTEHGMEAKLVPAAGFDLQKIQIGGLNRVGLRQTFATLGRLPIATVSSDRCVRDASAVFSMGGYVAGPPVLAAILRRIPVVVMEPNAVPGFTNRSISRLVARALVSFPETAAFFPSGRTEVTGLPVREEFFRIQPKPRGPVLHLLITGGSQGSRTLNHAARQSWPLFRKAGFPIRITHQTGAAGFAEIRDAFAQSGHRGRSRALHLRHARRLRRRRSRGLPLRRRRRLRTRRRRQAVDSGSVPLRRRQSPDAQRPGHGARRRIAPGARRRNDRRETVRNCEPNYRGPGRRWAKPPGSSPNPAPPDAPRTF